jgi:hypothetical protein
MDKVQTADDSEGKVHVNLISSFEEASLNKAVIICCVVEDYQTCHSFHCFISA